MDAGVEHKTRISKFRAEMVCALHVQTRRCLGYVCWTKKDTQTTPLNQVPNIDGSNFDQDS